MYIFILYLYKLRSLSLCISHWGLSYTYCHAYTSQYQFVTRSPTCLATGYSSSVYVVPTYETAGKQINFLSVMEMMKYGLRGGVWGRGEDAQNSYMATAQNYEGILVFSMYTTKTQWNFKQVLESTAESLPTWHELLNKYVQFVKDFFFSEFLFFLKLWYHWESTFSISWSGLNELAFQAS